MRPRKLWPQVKAPTTERAPESVRCWKWDLRPTKIRTNRAQDLSPTKKQLTTRTKKRKQHASPTSSANFVVGENNVQVCLGEHEDRVATGIGEIMKLEKEIMETIEQMRKRHNKSLVQLTKTLSDIVDKQQQGMEQIAKYLVENLGQIDNGQKVTKTKNKNKSKFKVSSMKFKPHP